MEIIILDDFQPWTIYLLAFVALLAFLFALTMLIRSLLVSRRNVHAARNVSPSGRQSWFFTIGAALALWFLTSSMYFRFHAVGIGPHDIELVFFWPRPPVVLQTKDLVDVKLISAGRTCGYLEVATHDELIRSVNFRKCQSADAVLKQVSLRTHLDS